MDIDRLDQLMPQMLEVSLRTIASMKTMRDFMLASHSTMAGIQQQMQEAAKGSTVMGQYFDQAKNDDHRSTCRRKCSTIPTSSVGEDVRVAGW